MKEVNVMPETIRTVQNDIRQRPLAYVVQIVGIIVVLLNLWIAFKLAPLTENLAVIATRVQALEEGYDSFVPRIEIKGQLEEISRRLGNIEGKLE